MVRHASGAGVPCGVGAGGAKCGCFDRCGVWWEACSGFCGGLGAWAALALTTSDGWPKTSAQSFFLRRAGMPGPNSCVCAAMDKLASSQAYLHGVAHTMQLPNRYYVLGSGTRER